LGYLIWGDIPDLATIAGVSITVVAGFYILHRERM
jgi:drug/metabolite transporter (DMT)-like permease